MAEDLTVLVNSTDSFEDCWGPFFSLLKKHWPTCAFPIVINTETKSFFVEGLPVRASHIGQQVETCGPASWSDCLIACLKGITTPYVLYLQEDYFIEAPVDDRLLRDCIDVMKSNGIAHCQLMQTERCDVGPVWRRDPRFALMKKKANYRVSTQAGIWKREVLLSYLVSGETGWDFERRATLRSYDRDDVFICIPADFGSFPDGFVVPYTPTGVIRGKWNVHVVEELFKQHGVDVDFRRRGEYRMEGAESRRVRVRYFVRRAAMGALSSSRTLREAYLRWFQ